MCLDYEPPSLYYVFRLRALSVFMLRASGVIQALEIWNLPWGGDWDQVGQGRNAVGRKNSTAGYEPPSPSSGYEIRSVSSRPEARPSSVRLNPGSAFLDLKELQYKLIVHLRLNVFNDEHYLTRTELDVLKRVSLRPQSGDATHVG